MVRRTAELASAHGLDAVSVGALAADLGMSKAGIVGQFGNKLELQLQAFELARDLFVDAVWTPVRRKRAGLERLLAVCKTWAAYAGEPPFAGGCLIVAASVEFDDKPGPLRDAVADALRAWRATIVSDIQVALEAGDLAPNVDPQHLAYVLEALAARAQPAISLLGDLNAADICRTEMLAAVRRCQPAANPQRPSAARTRRSRRQVAG